MSEPTETVSGILEDAMAGVCDEVCKYNAHANEMASEGEEYLRPYCEKCPLKRLI